MIKVWSTSDADYVGDPDHTVRRHADKDDRYLVFSDGTCLLATYTVANTDTYHFEVRRFKVIKEGASFISVDRSRETLDKYGSEIAYLGDDVKWFVAGPKISLRGE